MNTVEMIKAWKNPAQRTSLNAENPAGMIELTGTALEMVSGGGKKSSCYNPCGNGSNKSGKSGKSNKSKKSKKSRKSNKSGSNGSGGGGCW